MMTKPSAILALAAFASSLALAAPAFAVSSSFETGVTGVQYGPDQSGAHNDNSDPANPVSVPTFEFHGYSGVISNGYSGVFPNTSDGTNAAFLQNYSGDGAAYQGSEIVWNIAGLTLGTTYKLSFSDVAGGLVPANPFSVSAFGGGPVVYTPTSTYTSHALFFTPTSANGTINFLSLGNLSNQASAIDSVLISAAPEPSTWALMLVGIGGAGLALRAAKRRRSSAATA